MPDKSVSYSINLEIPEGYIGNLLDFIYQKYLLRQKQTFSNIVRTMDNGRSSLAFTVLDESGKQALRTEVKGTKPISVEIGSLAENVRNEAMVQIKQDIVILVELFEEKVRASTLVFAWREGGEVTPERMSGKEKKSINRLLLETQVFLFMIFVALGLFLFPLMGLYAPIALMAIQFIIVFYSSKFIERTADWHINKDDPTIHLLKYVLPLEEHDDLIKKYPPEKIGEIKKEIYEQTIARKGEIDCSTTGEIFKKART